PAGAGGARAAAPLRRAGGGRERRARADLECHRLLARVAIEVAQRVLALVGLEVDRVLRGFAHFEAEHVGGETRRPFEVARTEPDETNALQVDHSEPSIFRSRQTRAKCSRCPRRKTIRAGGETGAAGALCHPRLACPRPRS